MFGIEDPGIWISYLMSFGCVIFAVWFGITRWNKDDDSKKPTKDTEE